MESFAIDPTAVDHTEPLNQCDPGDSANIRDHDRPLPLGGNRIEGTHWNARSRAWQDVLALELLFTSS
ncbi:MAG: hypothetical protein QOF73_3493 [Thermomicrobiales bacterium]|nr:hypothetical protein [Thermomicrobiales bacterium]